MGAIAGVVYADAQPGADLVEPMLEIMEVRGRSHREVHAWRNVQLGSYKQILRKHEHQPIIGVLDGFILNEDQIRSELEKVGYQFTFNSTTDLLIAAYHHWGIDFLNHLDGEFSIGLLDTRSEELLIARDRIGKKPLYWFHDIHYFLFASELKALLFTGAVPQTPATEAIASYLSLGYWPQDVTPIAGVNKLLPGYYLLLKLGRYKMIRPYWSYSSYFVHPVADSPEEITHQIDERLREAVKKRVGSAESIGCMLSDSIGSTTIASYLHKLRYQQRLTAFTVGLQKGDSQHLDAASEVARAFELSQVVEVVTPTNALQELPKIIWFLDEPLAEITVLLTWRLARLSAMTSDRVFSGMGYNELFVTHPRYSLEKKPMFARQSQLLWRSMAHYLLKPLLNWLRRPMALSLIRHLQVDPWQAEYLRANTIFDPKNLSQASPKLSGFFEADVLLQKFHNLKRISSPLTAFMYLDVKTRLPDQMILQYDRLTAAFGLNWQAPFLDTAFMQYLAGLPRSDRDLKDILRQDLPDALINRPKSLEKPWISSWAADPNIVRAFELMETGILADTGLLSRPWLQHQLSSSSNRSRAFEQLWAFLVLEVWFRIYIQRPVTSTAPDISLLALLKNE